MKRHVKGSIVGLIRVFVSNCRQHFSRLSHVHVTGFRCRIIIVSARHRLDGWVGVKSFVKSTTYDAKFMPIMPDLIDATLMVLACTNIEYRKCENLVSILNSPWALSIRDMLRIPVHC